MPYGGTVLKHGSHLLGQSGCSSCENTSLHTFVHRMKALKENAIRHYTKVGRSQDTNIVPLSKVVIVYTVSCRVHETTTPNHSKNFKQLQSVWRV